MQQILLERFTWGRDRHTFLDDPKAGPAAWLLDLNNKTGSKSGTAVVAYSKAEKAEDGDKEEEADKKEAKQQEDEDKSSSSGGKGEQEGKGEDKRTKSDKGDKKNKEEEEEEEGAGKAKAKGVVASTLNCGGQAW